MCSGTGLKRTKKHTESQIKHNVNIEKKITIIANTTELHSVKYEKPKPAQLKFRTSNIRTHRSSQQYKKYKTSHLNVSKNFLYTNITISIHQTRTSYNTKYFIKKKKNLHLESNDEVFTRMTNLHTTTAFTAIDIHLVVLLHSNLEKTKTNATNENINNQNSPIHPTPSNKTFSISNYTTENANKIKILKIEPAETN